MTWSNPVTVKVNSQERDLPLKLHLKAGETSTGYSGEKLYLFEAEVENAGSQTVIFNTGYWISDNPEVLVNYEEGNLRSNLLDNFRSEADLSRTLSLPPGERWKDEVSLSLKGEKPVTFKLGFKTVFAKTIWSEPLTIS